MRRVKKEKEKRKIAKKKKTAKKGETERRVSERQFPCYPHLDELTYDIYYIVPYLFQLFVVRSALQRGKKARKTKPAPVST